MKENKRNSTIGKKIKFLNFFFKNYNHYDSTTGNEKSNSDFFITSKTLSESKISPKNKTAINNKFFNFSTDEEHIKRSFVSNKAGKFKDVFPLKKMLIETMKSRDFNNSPLRSIINDLPKMQIPQRNSKSETELTNTTTTEHKKKLEERKEEINNIFEKNHETNKKIYNRLELLAQDDPKCKMDKQTWKDTVFKTGKDFLIKPRGSQEVFSIYTQNEKRHSFINELNYRLHYKKRNSKPTPNKKISLNLVPSPEFLKNFQNRQESPPKIKIENLQRNDFNKNEKNKSKIQEVDEPHDKIEDRISNEKLRRLKINLKRNSVLSSGNCSPTSKANDPGNPLPSDERVRYFMYPSLLMQNVCENLNYFKSIKNPKFFYNKIDNLIGSNPLMRKSFLDGDSKKVLEPLTPRSLYLRLLLNEKSSNYNSDYEKKHLKSRKSQLKSLFFNNPLKKINKETFDEIIDLNSKLEEQKIILEKKKIDFFKESILSEHKNILEQEIDLAEKYKKTRKIEQYKKLRQLLLNRDCLNLSVQNSDIFKQIKKLGQLKYVKKGNIANLQAFERFLFEMRNSENSMNEEIQ